MSVLLAACLLSTLNGTSATTLCATGQVDRAKVYCDNTNKPWKPCGTDLASTYKLTCADIEDQHKAGVDRSSYKYACCPQDSHPDSSCAAGLCENVNRDAIICDNKQAGSPCGSDQHAELVLTCGEIHDQITWGHKKPCGKTATDYRTAHPHCCGLVPIATIIAATVGGVLGCCCLGLGACGVFMMLRKGRKVVESDTEAGQKSSAHPVLQTNPVVPPAPQPVKLQQQVPQPISLEEQVNQFKLQQQVPQPVSMQQQVPAAIFCAACGTSLNQNAKFCNKCGNRL